MNPYLVPLNHLADLPWADGRVPRVIDDNPAVKYDIGHPVSLGSGLNELSIGQSASGVQKKSK
jgi:hypothetical protein